MTINTTDVKLMASQVLRDTDDGGGRATGNEVVSGEINNLFPDISRLDRTYGRVNLRKAFLQILTANTDIYYGAHSILTRPPVDDSVSALMFSTESHTDTRQKAKSFIESYVVRGTLSPYFLWERQLKGQRSIIMFCRPDALMPEVGDVLYLVANEDAGDEYSQFVRLVEVGWEDRQFTDPEGGCGTFTRRIITCTISVPLAHTFDGPVITCSDVIAGDTKVRNTQVADSAKYYGVGRLATNVSNGDLDVYLESIYGQIVPSTRGEAPLLDVQAGGASAVTINSGGEDFEIQVPAHSAETEISVNNRAYNYVFLLQPIPAPGALSIDYRAQGRWYRLQDNGAGELEGEGAGTVSYDTGSVSVTLSALPDVGTSIIAYWGAMVHFADRSGSTAFDAPSLLHQLEKAVEPGTLTITWLDSGGATRTATADIAGAITGDATGTVEHASGWVYIQFAVLPASNADIAFAFDGATTVRQTLSWTHAGGIATLQLSSVPIKPGSVELQALFFTVEQALIGGGECVENTSQGGGTQRICVPEIYAPQVSKYGETLLDDGAGAITGDGASIIDYTTGEVSFTADRSVTAPAYDGTGWADTPGDGMLSGNVHVSYQESSVTPSATTETLAAPAIKIDLLPGRREQIVPGTLRFSVGGVAHSDRGGQGLLYRNDGTVAGAVNYLQCIATIDDFTFSSTGVVITSMVTTYGAWYDYDFRFRTSGSPLQPGGFIIQATALDGSLISAVADLSGIISDTLIEGNISFETGVGRVKFGELVLDSSLTTEEKAESWYDANDVDEDGYIWRPTYVYPNTVRYNVVVYTVLPLDADILGLDPVRLPSDGRVPVYRPGDVLVLHQEDYYTLPNPLTAAAEVALPVGYLASVELRDQDDNLLPEEWYTVDLKTGNIVMADPLDLTGYVEPIEAWYTFEDMSLVSDVQITGQLTCTKAFGHTFDKNKAWASGALIHGDLQARAYGFFEQNSWTGVWDDNLIGSEPLASYNLTDYPLIVRNDGAVKERWLIKFKSTTTFDLIGESIGIITSGDTYTDLAPINPNSGVAYFTLYAGGWGTGWAVGNCIRFDTDACGSPIWFARTTLSSDATVEEDSFTVQNRGDAD